MAETFLKVLKDLEVRCLWAASKDEGYGLSAGAKNVLKRLIKFIEGGTFTNSQTEKFILENFRCRPSELVDKWNREHFERKKSAHTLRSQISSLNSYVVSLFGLGAGELNDVFINEDKKALRGIVDIINAFEVGDFNVAERFLFISRVHLPSGGTDSVYSVEECEEEVRLLRTLDIKAIDELVSRVDLDKLAYVIQTISQPLVINVYKKREGRSSKARTASVNRTKLEFNKKFNLVKPRELKPVDSIEVEPPEAGVSAQPTREVQEIVEGSEKIPFNLGISKQLADILARGIKAYGNLPEERKEIFQRKATDESRAECEKFLHFFTPEGFKAALNSLNAFDLNNIIDEYRK